MDAAAESRNSGGWSSATNWSVAEGSLANSITVESSLSPIDESLPKSPLILNPPSADSGPCEINIRFTQKHEIRQVYVRSSARVYEMYWAPDLESINEYLCTVRCSVAAKDEKSLHATDIEYPVSTHIEGSDGKLAEENLKNGSSVGSNEDGWVEVKAPDSQPLDNGSSSLQSKINTNAGRISQDFYEATAEISDADPCISLTLRLLSLQNKECVYVDEIYVFADPVESDGSDGQVGCLENPAGSSLMAMLVPTLLQLSKAGINRNQDKRMSDIREDRRCSKIGTTTDSTNIINKIQEEGKSCLPDQQEVDDATAERAPTSAKISNLVPGTESKSEYVANENNFPYNQLEKTMEHLVSRVGRIEYLFLRFEESMLKPISTIEARLQRVEQQLEALTQKFEGPGVTSTRIFAPEFPCNESDSNSCNQSSDCPSHGALECDEKDSVNATLLHPSLVVIAPEFSNGDEEENDASESQRDTLRENDAPEPVKCSPRDEPKHTMSVDDALASALAGFLSSTSVGPSKYTETLTVRAPDFPSEEDSSDDIIASPRVHREIPNGTENTKDPISTSCNLSLSESGGEVDNDILGETAEGIETQSQLDHEREEFNYVESGVSSSIVEENQVASRIDDHQTIEKTDRTEASSVPISDEIYVPICFLGDQIDDASDTPTPQEETFESTDLTNATEVTDGQTTKDILLDFLQFSCSPSAVDFQVPILDVKFNSQENPNANSYLKALLINITEPSSSNLGAPCIEEIQDDTPSSKQCNSVPADDGGIQGHACNNHLLLDFDYSKAPAGTEGENQQDPHTCSQDGLFESLI